MTAGLVWQRYDVAAGMFWQLDCSASLAIVLAALKPAIVLASMIVQQR